MIVVVIMKKALIFIHGAVHVIHLPFHHAVRVLPAPLKSKRATKVVIGICISCTGSAIALHPIEIVPHIIWDAIAYTLHGYGAIPVVKILCEKFNLESLDD